MSRFWNLTTGLDFRWGCALLSAILAGGLPGCGTGPAAENAKNPPVEVRGVDNSSVAGAGNSQSRPLAESPDPAANQRAGELLDVLSRPGTGGTEWDAAQNELISMNSGALPALVSGLESDNRMRREMSATMLALLGPEAEAAAPALQKALKDDSQFVRANAAAALVQFPEQAPLAVPTLIELLSSGDPQLRQLAAMNLGAVDAQAADHVPQLVTAIGTESAPEVLLPVLELLGRIGPAARPALPRISELAKQGSGEVGAAATQAIQLISGEAGAP